jgi:hypothetical protein
MENDDFLKSVQNARHEADEADSSRDTLVLWAKRLLPYLNDNPHLTIAQAIDLYLAGIPHMASVFDPKSTVPVVSGGRRRPEL